MPPRRAKKATRTKGTQVVAKKPVEKQEQTHLSYLLHLKRNYTYSGYTVNFPRRLRQHRGEIKGGARYTTRIHPGFWEPVLYISGFENKTKCLRFEHCTKIKKRRRGKETNLEKRFTQWLRDTNIYLAKSENVKRRALSFLHMVYVEPEWKDKNLQVTWFDDQLSTLQLYFSN